MLGGGGGVVLLFRLGSGSSAPARASSKLGRTGLGSVFGLLEGLWDSLAPDGGTVKLEAADRVGDFSADLARIFEGSGDDVFRVRSGVLDLALLA